MTNRDWNLLGLAALVATTCWLPGGVAHAAGTPQQKCEQAKLKIVSKYIACRLKADASVVVTALPPDYSKCELLISAGWLKAEAAGGCLPIGDQAAVQAKATGDTAILTGDLASSPLCGNGSIDAEEDCDGANLDSNSCATVGFASGTLSCTPACRFDTTACTLCGNGLKNLTEACDDADLGGETCAMLGYALGGTLACTTNCTLDVGGCVGQSFPATGQSVLSAIGDDGEVQAGATLSYFDNGDGTVIDLNTQLTWEKKDSRGGGVSVSNLHDADNCYPWGGSCSISGAHCGTDADCGGGGDTCFSFDCQGGTLTIFQWVAKLNTVPCFAGHCDWRIPNKKELESLIDAHVSNPAIARPYFKGASCGSGCTTITDPACSCTASTGYWSSTTYQASSGQAIVQDFSDGLNWSDNKWDTTTDAVRAVRGGL